MNYKKIHDNAIKNFRSTNPRERLKNRQPNDKRLNDKSLYVEIHHIIPSSLGGFDDESNLVEVLPEEHLFLHMLRYKIYSKREDMLAVRFMLNGIASKPILASDKISLNKKLRMGYAWLRSHAQHLRKNEGWHTEDGIKRISEARKGTMPAKDINTGKMVGTVRLDHPNVLSGKWVHHSKGRKQSQKEKDYKREKNKGQNNPNASGLSEEYFIEKGAEAYKEFGQIISWGNMLILSQLRGFKWIKSLRSRFDNEGTLGYYKALSTKLGIPLEEPKRFKIC